MGGTVRRAVRRSAVPSTKYDHLIPGGREQARELMDRYMEAAVAEARVEAAASERQVFPSVVAQMVALINTLHMGGAVADVGPEDTAFADRTSPFMVSIDGTWTDSADDAEKIA